MTTAMTTSTNTTTSRSVRTTTITARKRRRVIITMDWTEKSTKLTRKGTMTTKAMSTQTIMKVKRSVLSARNVAVKEAGENLLVRT